MGQYYSWFLTENNDKFELLARGDGAKLLEASGLVDTGVLKVLGYIKDDPQEIAFIGDYWDDYLDDFESQKELIEKMKGKIAGLKGDFSEASFEGKRILDFCQYGFLEENKNNFESLFKKIGLELQKTKIINHTRKEFIDFPNPSKRIKEEKINGMRLLYNHPLTILCAVGNGMGGGDFTKRSMANKPELAGLWAFDKIESSDDPRNFKEYVDKTKDYEFISD